LHALSSKLENDEGVLDKLGLLRDTCTGIDRELKENSNALSGVNAELKALKDLLRQAAMP
jgi:hypothetical protein